MVDAVLDKRLQDQLDDRPVKQRLVQIIMHVQHPAEPNLLDRNVIFDQLDFLFQEDHPFPFFQRDPIILRQMADHLVDLRAALLQGERGNRRQCVIQKMRVNLCLQRRQLRILHGDFLDVHLVDQLLDSGGHLLKGVRQLPDFIVAHRFAFHLEIPPLHLANLLQQHLDPLRNHLRRKENQQRSHRNHGYGNPDNPLRRLIRIGQQLVIWNGNDRRPTIT
ncbi:hypothetical protein D3C81_1201570 [compost metagenome]